MKIVIRKSVFETNSSSTHSLVYSSSEPEEFTFRCESPESRLVMLQALKNADSYDCPRNNSKKGKQIRLRGEAFLKACFEVYSKKEKVPLDEVKQKLFDHFYKKIYTNADEKRMNEWFLRAFDEASDSLCSFLFEEGCLDFCECGYDKFETCLNEIFSGEDQNDLSSYPRVAEEYLYGKYCFYAEEYYAGVKFINSKTKY